MAMTTASANNTGLEQEPGGAGELEEAGRDHRDG